MRRIQNELFLRACASGEASVYRIDALDSLLLTIARGRQPDEEDCEECLLLAKQLREAVAVTKGR